MQLNSESVLKGAERAPNRSLFYALGYTDEEINRPLIGVVSAYSEIVPGHAHLDKLAEAVKAGVRMAGGTPILVPSIGVCDGIAMGHIGMKYSLPSRELICDSVETMARAHGFDGLVLVPNCDKIVPGMLMAAARLNIPSIVVSGGPMLSGRQGTRHVSLSQMFEAVGSYKAGIIGEDVLDDYTKNTCPGCGSCSGMYTANSMNCLCEAIGMALPGNGTIPAVYAARTQLAKHAGMRIMDLVRDGVRPRDILTPAAFRNALATDMALGCSSNSVLHLLAIANEADVPMSLETFNEMSAKVPNFCQPCPGRPHAYRGPVRRGRRARCHGAAGRAGPAGYQPAHGDGQNRGREHCRRAEPRYKRHPSRGRPVQQDGRHRRDVGQHCAERLRGEAQRGRSRDAGAQRSRAGV